MERIGLGLALVALLCTTNAFAQTNMRTATANPLLAIDQHRASVVERILGEWGDALALSGAGLTRAQLREMLDGLRADQLLAATLVNTLDEVLRVVREPVVAVAVGQRYVAITPTEALELRVVPDAQAYLVRDGEMLSVVKPAELQLTGRNRVVGYFTADAGPSVTTVVQERPLGKDGSGSGANSWIGYTAGGNVASGSGSAVAAGTNNVASGPNAFVGAGTFNAATAQGAFVGGGTSNVAAGISSLVIGGFDNQARVIDALVVAGAGNRATGARSVVVGGGYNLASGQWSFIGGGGRQTANSGAAGTYVEDNVAAGDFSTIGGGQGNRTGPGILSTVGGGLDNTASEFYATVAGGIQNTASGGDATVAGGSFNTASGISATVPGGTSNQAIGTSSFAAGGSAVVTHHNSFLWCDGHTTCNSQNNQDFIVVASGGIKLYTADGLGGCVLTNPAGQGWFCSSDRNLKENFVELDALDVLRRVSAMPVTRWNVKGVPGERHIGPVAQDFYAAFGLGGDDLHIAAGNLSGVGLAAIQGLNAKLEERVGEQQREIAELRRLLLDLRSTIEVKAAMR